jgi:hypothetical protein
MGWDFQHYYDLLQQIWKRHYIMISWTENDSHALNTLMIEKILHRRHLTQNLGWAYVI